MTLADGLSLLHLPLPAFYIALVVRSIRNRKPQHFRDGLECREPRFNDDVRLDVDVGHDGVDVVRVLLGLVAAHARRRATWGTGRVKGEKKREARETRWVSEDGCTGGMWSIVLERMDRAGAPEGSAGHPPA